MTRASTPVGRILADLLSRGADITAATVDRYGTVEVLGHVVRADHRGQMNVSARGEDGFASEDGLVTTDATAVAEYIWQGSR
jgi:hypothetical protein